MARPAPVAEAPSGPAPARGGGGYSTPAAPPPASRRHLHPASSFWGKGFPRAAAHRLPRAPCSFGMAEYLFGPRRRHRWFVFLRPTGTHECARCPAGEAGSRTAGCRAVRAQCAHPGSKEREIPPALRGNGLFPAPDLTHLPASVRLTDGALILPHTPHRALGRKISLSRSSPRSGKVIKSEPRH